MDLVISRIEDRKISMASLLIPNYIVTTKYYTKENRSL